MHNSTISLVCWKFPSIPPPHRVIMWPVPAIFLCFWNHGCDSNWCLVLYWAVYGEIYDQWITEIALGTNTSPGDYLSDPVLQRRGTFAQPVSQDCGSADGTDVPEPKHLRWVEFMSLHIPFFINISFQSHWRSGLDVYAMTSVCPSTATHWDKKAGSESSGFSDDSVDLASR